MRVWLVERCGEGKSPEVERLCNEHVLEVASTTDARSLSSDMISIKEVNS
jgi:hypothetical protein